MNQNTKRSKWWSIMCDILDGQFPKGKCKERGKALVMLAYLEMMLNGTEFNDDGEPIRIMKNPDTNPNEWQRFRTFLTNCGVGGERILDEIQGHVQLMRESARKQERERVLEILEKRSKENCDKCNGSGARPLSMFDMRIGSRCRGCNGSGEKVNQAIFDAKLEIEELKTKLKEST